MRTPPRQWHSAMRSAGMGPQGPARFGETAKILPVLFVVCNIAGLWAIYMWFHCLPQLRSKDHHQKAVLETAAFNIVAALLIVCYVQCILVHPGTIPDKEEDASWEYIPQDGRSPAVDTDGHVLETKKSGDRRYCKWCTKYKPDRCHHCRVCRMCILKMDHHCPWIYNCVGFRNHKYFFLLLLYSAIACHIITWTMLESVLTSVAAPAPFATMFCLLFGETLAAFIGILVTVFFAFHVWLMLKAMTTIEFCEKNRSKSTAGAGSTYDRGVGGNIRAVLGDNFLLWLLPLSPPSGRGLKFVDDDLRLARDLETQRGGRRRSHRRSGEGRERRHHAPSGQAEPEVRDGFEDAALNKAHGAHGYGYGAVNDQEDCCDIIADKRRARRDHGAFALC